MGETTATYPGDPEGENVWTRRDRLREYQARRQLDITLADNYLDLARAYVRLGRRWTPRACGLCMRSANLYQVAGMTRRGQVVWRYARMLHRGRSAATGSASEGRP